MRPLITVTAVVLVHLCVIAVLVGVNGCRSTSGFEAPGDPAVFSGGARPATPPPPVIAARIPTPAPTLVAPIARAGSGGRYTVIRGDTLFTVARRENVTLAALAKENRLPLNTLLKVGQILVIPAAPANAAPVGVPKK